MSAGAGSLGERLPGEGAPPPGDEGARWPLSPLPFAPTLRAQRRALAALILLALAALKVARQVEVPWYDLDAWFYADVALNVRDGLGLTTYYSLYNKGFTYFPHPTSIYPLWPLTLGLVSRLIPFGVAAWSLPSALSLAALAVAYRLVARLVPGPLFPEVWPVLDAGHLFILMLGTSRHYFLSTSLPYTEALAFLLLFIALGRIARLYQAPTAWRGLEVGVWLALLIMARSQLFIVTLALGASLALTLALTGLRRMALPALAVAVGLGLGLAPWWAYLSSFADGVRFSWMLRFDAYHETTLLPHLSFMVPTEGLWAFIADRAQGVPVAFSGHGRFSYFRNFYVLYFGLVVAAPLALWEALQGLRAGRGPAALRWLRAPQSQLPLFLGMLSLAGIASLHVLHKQHFHAWNFGTRHALTAVFIFFAALVYLSRRPVLPRLYALVIIIVGVYLGFDQIVKMGEPRAALAPTPTTERGALVTWIDAHRAEGDPLVLASDIGRELQPFTRGVGWHWIYRTTTAADLDAFAGPLGVDYLFVDRARRYPFLSPARRFEAGWERVAEDVSGIDIYRPRRPEDR